MPNISFHAFSAIISALLALGCGVRVLNHYRGTKNTLVKYLAFDFLCQSVAIFSLVPPSLLFRSDLLPPFLAFAVFFLFLGIAFFLRIVVNFFDNIAKYERLVFFFISVCGIGAAVFTFYSSPTLVFGESGLFTAYVFSPALKMMLIIFTIFLTSLFSGFIFILKGLSSDMFVEKIRSVLLGLALVFIGMGVLLVILGESFVYNLFIVFAFLFFFSSVSIRKGAVQKS